MHRSLLAPLLCSVVLVAGCDDFEQALICIDDDRPQFSRYELPEATRGQSYEESVIASLKNTTNDGDFTYTFSLSGDLPPGVAFSASGRTATFAGTPEVSGTFMPTLRVKISDGDAELFGADGDADTLCKTERTHTYALVVVAP